MRTPELVREEIFSCSKFELITYLSLMMTWHLRYGLCRIILYLIPFFFHFQKDTNLELPLRALMYAGLSIVGGCISNSATSYTIAVGGTELRING